METKLFSRFRSLREAYRMIEQDDKGVVRRGCVLFPRFPLVMQRSHRMDPAFSYNTACIM